MSFAIINGQLPTRKQLILDRQLDELVAETGREEDRYSFGKLVFKCLRDRPHLINSVDASIERSITNGEMLEKSIKTARALKADGVGVKDVVMIIGVNHLELAMPYYAAFFLANLPINVDVGATAYELENILKITKPKIIFSDAIKIETVKEALSSAGLKSTIISFGKESTSEISSLDEFMRPFSGNIENFKAVNVNRDDPALLLSTSGSTGLPKVPILTNYCLVAQLPIFSSNEIMTDLPPGAPKNLVLMTSQWFAYYSSISVGAAYGYQRIQTQHRAVPQHVLDITRKHRPHAVFLSPSYVSLLFNHPEYAQGDLSSFYTVLISGAVLSAQMQDELKKAIHPAGQIAYTYGCTELGGGLLVSNNHIVQNSIGSEQNTMRYKIVDEDGNDVEVGTTGELILKPKATFFKGYLNNEEATKGVLTEEGWFKTGDLVHKNEQNHYFYVDRKKLLITFGNNHIYPNELEGVIESIAGVLEVAVCGSAKGPTALVVRQPGSTLKEQEIHDVINTKLSAYKRLVGGVFFVDSLPKTVTGKLGRNKLKDIVEKLQK